MVNNCLKFEIRIKSLSIQKDKVVKAKISYIKQEGLFKVGFWGRANEKVPKIYILKNKKEIIYVGITKMPLSNRFRFGLMASGKNGYHGYAWKQLSAKGELDSIKLYVYLFESEERTEAIEAEIAYLIRHKAGRWPVYQTEIHFHQANIKEINMAEKIFIDISKN